MTKTTHQHAFHSVITLLLVVPNMLLHGWLFTYVWRWFVVEPLGAAPIGIADGLGLSVIFAWFTSGMPRDKEHEGEPLQQMVYSALMTVGLFGIGALIHVFQ